MSGTQLAILKHDRGKINKKLENNIVKEVDDSLRIIEKRIYYMDS